jgi:hypothetical protein
MRKNIMFAMASLAFLPAVGHAAAPTLAEVFEASGITESGYLDASYNYLNSDGVFTSGTASRVFDNQPNGFTFNQAAITLAKQPAQGFGGLVNLTLGHDADIIKSVGGGTVSNFDVTQAFIQYASGNFTTILGKYVTASGAEVINTPSNTNASRGILFGYAIPFTHTGVRTSYKFSDALTVFGGVNNGWDQQTDLNKQKTVELGLAATPIKPLALAAVIYSGNEPGLTGVNGRRDLLDLVATFTATDKLNFVLNYDYAKQKDAISAGNDAKWAGFAAYANAKLSDLLRLSVRGEYFDDKDGYRTGVAQKWKEVSVTLGIDPAPNFELMAEVRGDKSDKKSFSADNGTNAKQNQVSGTLKAVYKF